MSAPNKTVTPIPSLFPINRRIATILLKVRFLDTWGIINYALSRKTEKDAVAYFASILETAQFGYILVEGRKVITGKESSLLADFFALMADRYPELGLMGAIGGIINKLV